MLWSLVKILAFVALATALAFGVSFIVETPGEVRIAFGPREFFLTPMGFVVAVGLLVIATLLAIKLIFLCYALLRFLMGDQTAFTRYFARNRRRRGYEALSTSMLALAEGDAKLAQRKAEKAQGLLGESTMTRLLRVQAAVQSGDGAKIEECYKEMLEDDRTRPIAVEGLMQQRLAQGDTETALALAKKAFALRPDNARVLRTLFDLQSRKADWAGARATLNASVSARALPRDVGTRREAVLSLADAQAALAAGDTARGNEAALQANRLAPTLVPAAILASNAHAAAGSKRKAMKVLTYAWGENPHPDLAAAFAAIDPGETTQARRRRFLSLTAAAPQHSESRLLEAELALADEDFPGARKALGDLAETRPTTRSLAIMAAIERGQGAPEAVVRGWLAKALGASRGPQWVCASCNQIHTHWVPVCEGCEAFDTLEWKTPVHGEDAGISQSAMLPLIVGAIEEQQPDEPEGVETEPPEPASEAELAEDAQAAARSV